VDEYHTRGKKFENGEECFLENLENSKWEQKNYMRRTTFVEHVDRMGLLCSGVSIFQYFRDENDATHDISLKKWSLKLPAQHFDGDIGVKSNKHNPIKGADAKRWDTKNTCLKKTRLCKFASGYNAAKQNTKPSRQRFA